MTAAQTRLLLRRTNYQLLLLLLLLVLHAGIIGQGVAQQQRPQSSLPPPLVAGQPCKPSAVSQQWKFQSSGLLSSTDAETGDTLCLAPSTLPVADGTHLAMVNCSDAQPQQQFQYNTTGVTDSIVLRSLPNFCINLRGYGTSPGTEVWLFHCSVSDCKGNCDWKLRSAEHTEITAAAQQSFRDVQTFSIVNPESGLCLDNGRGPPLPRTCSPESPESKLPFCNFSLSHEQRVTDLLSRLDFDTRVALYSIPAIPNTYNASLNFKSILWDITCIHGLSPGKLQPNPNVTVFPHAIALAASFDPSLIAEVSRVTAVEGRIVNQINYRATAGTTFQGVQCDGGPLANSVHDPRWGRISETYGEDPYLCSLMGVTATRALQNRTGAWLQTSQVTRHFLGYHGATDLPRGGEENITTQFLQDQQLPIYRAFQVQGGAEGIMCAMNTLNGVPSCMSPLLLQHYLRDQWNSTCFVQTDCCDSISQAVTAHHTYESIEDATVAAITTGVQASYGPSSFKSISDALRDAIAKKRITEQLLNERLARTLLTRFRLGEFDYHNPDFPFRGPYNESLLDGMAHRAFAREAVARTLVLLENRVGLLPLAKLPSTVAVLGPMAHCNATEGGYGGHDSDNPFQCSYLHSYSGSTSVVNTVLDAVQREAAAQGSKVLHSRGTNLLTNMSDTGISDAVALAKQSDLVLLVVGLSSLVEAEGRDRVDLRLPSVQQQLFDAVSDVVPSHKLVVIVVSAGGVDLPYGVPDTVIQAWYGGEEMGSGLMDVMLGRTAPSGRLPLTFYTQEYLQHVGPVADFNMLSNGTGRTYRYASRISDPLINYWFGYGLSYTTFHYSNLTVDGKKAWEEHAELHQGARAYGTSCPNITVTASVTNSGKRSAREVLQLYVTTVMPLADGTNVTLDNLRASSVVYLSPGQTAQLVFQLDCDNDFSVALPDGSRTVLGGDYIISVSGHTPQDVKGLRSSNVVQTTVRLPQPSHVYH